MLRVLRRLADGLPWDELPNLIIQAYEAETGQSRPDVDVELRVKKAIYVHEWTRKINTETTPIMSEDYLARMKSEYRLYDHNYRRDPLLINVDTNLYVALVYNDQVSLEEFLEQAKDITRSLSDINLTISPMLRHGAFINRDDISYCDRLDVFVSCVMSLIRLPTLVEAGCFDEILDIFNGEDLDELHHEMLERGKKLVKIMTHHYEDEVVQDFPRLCREGYLRIDSYIYYLDRMNFDKEMDAIEDDLSKLDELKFTPAKHLSKLRNVSEAILGVHRLYNDEWQGSDALKGMILRGDDHQALVNYAALYLLEARIDRENYQAEQKMLEPIRENGQSLSFHQDYAAYRYHLEKLRPTRAKAARP